MMPKQVSHVIFQKYISVTYHCPSQKLKTPFLFSILALLSLSQINKMTGMKLKLLTL
jgi:hypothetical protein